MKYEISEIDCAARIKPFSYKSHLTRTDFQRVVQQVISQQRWKIKQEVERLIEFRTRTGRRARRDDFLKFLCETTFEESYYLLQFIDSIPELLAYSSSGKVSFRGAGFTHVEYDAASCLFNDSNEPRNLEMFLAEVVAQTIAPFEETKMIVSTLYAREDITMELVTRGYELVWWDWQYTILHNRIIAPNEKPCIDTYMPDLDLDKFDE